MHKIVALVSVCTVAVTVPALAQTQGHPTNADAQALPPIPDSQTCAPAKQVYSESNWRDPSPVNGRTVCPGGRDVRSHFYLYRRYRQIAPYRCLRGSEGYFSIPCSIISCESHFSWSAANSSGAVGPYQLLGWGAPYPARTFAQRVANHRIAASVWAGGSGRSNWVC